MRAHRPPRVDFRGCDPREIGLDRCSGEIAERVYRAIETDESAGEPPLLPLLNRHRPIADTSVVGFKTVKPCFATRKSDINQVAADTPTWEQAAAFAPEALDHLITYARNDHLEFTIPYEYLGIVHGCLPDFLVRLPDETTLILEIKGEEDNEDRANTRPPAAGSLRSTTGESSAAAGSTFAVIPASSP